MSVKRALEIATRDLRANYIGGHIVAGMRNYSEPWARDFSFASLGACALGDFDVVKSTLDLFLENQAPSGQLPLRFERPALFLKGMRVFMGLDGRGSGAPGQQLTTRVPRQAPGAKAVPRYVTDYFTTPADSNPLIIIAAANYIRKSKDSRFLCDNYERLERALAWLCAQDRDGDNLIEQDPFGDWADTVMARSGKVSYTNALWFRAAQDMEWVARRAGEWKRSVQHRALSEKICAAFNRAFWMKGRGYYRHTPALTNFSSDGNILASYYGIADTAKSESILEYARKYGLESPVPMKVIHPRYDLYSVSWVAHFMGMSEYHGNWAWPWLGGFDALARHRLGDRKGAREIMERMGALFERDGTAHEVYGDDGMPIKRRFYKSDAPFSWSAGVFIHAAKETGMC